MFPKAWHDFLKLLLILTIVHYAVQLHKMVFEVFSSIKIFWTFDFCLHSFNLFYQPPDFIVKSRFYKPKPNEV